MSGNTQPRFTGSAVFGAATVTAANTNSDGTGNLTTPTIYRVLAAGANDSYVENVRVCLVANAASTATAATTIRLYMSTIASGATSSADTHLLTEIPVPASTADQPSTATTPIDWPLGITIPSGYYLLASSHAAANANTAYKVLALGAGNY